MSHRPPEIREMQNGDVVVDLGDIWFRCRINGEVTVKKVVAGVLTVRPATSKERLFALGYAAFDGIV